MNEEIFRQRAKAAGYSDEEIEKFLASKRTPMKDELLGGAADLAQGATLGLAGAAIPAVKAKAKQFEANHSILGPATNIAGNVLGALAIPGSFAARLGGRVALGATAGGIQGATSDASSLEDRAKHAAEGAALGGVAGAVLPPVAKVAGRLGKLAISPFRNPESIAAEAGAMLPKGAERLMARQEALAPGTTVPAVLDPGLPKAVRVVGSNPQVAREAMEASAARVERLQAARDAMRPQYQALLAQKRAPLDLGPDKPNIRKVIISNGMWPGDETIELEAVQGLRDALEQKIETLAAKSAKGKGGGPLMHKLNEQKKQLSQWLHAMVPELKDLDRDYGVLSRAKRAEESIQKNLAGSRSGNMAARIAGIEPGTPGSSLPSTKSGILHRLFHPDRDELARAANRMLLQPGQIPSELLKARAAAARPGGQYAGLLPFLSGAELGRVPGLLDLPNELQQ